MRCAGRLTPEDWVNFRCVIRDMDHVVLSHISGGISRVEQTADPPLELDHPCVGHRLELSRAVRARAWPRIKDEHRKQGVPRLLKVHGLRTDVRPVARCNRQWHTGGEANRACLIR